MIGRWAELLNALIYATMVTVPALLAAIVLVKVLQ